MRILGLTIVSAAFVSAPIFALTPEDKCEAAKNKEAGKYAFCRQKAEMKAIKKGAAPDFTKCDAKLVKKWLKAEAVAAKKGASCVDAVSDTEIQSFVTAHADAVAAALDGGSLPECGDNSVNATGEHCDGTDLGGEDCTTLGFTSGTLSCSPSCGFDTGGCETGTGIIPGLDPILLTSGQTAAFGAGTDGDVQAGQPLSYTDNGDGTVTDNTTGLMWEKKDDSGGIHDKDNGYTWCDASCSGANAMDGTIKSVFLDTLNDVGGGGTNCFAAHCDWRIPNIRELLSIVDYAIAIPPVDPAFHDAVGCTGCVDVTAPSCSCTAATDYWTSTTYNLSTSGARTVFFNSGGASSTNKFVSRKARAVRGGL